MTFFVQFNCLKEVKHDVYYTSHPHLDMASKLLRFWLHCFSKFHVYEQFIDSGDLTEHFTSIKARRSRMMWKHWLVFVCRYIQSDVSLDLHRKCWSFKQWGEFLILLNGLRPSDWSVWTITEQEITSPSFHIHLEGARMPLNQCKSSSRMHRCSSVTSLLLWTSLCFGSAEDIDCGHLSILGNEGNMVT